MGYILFIYIYTYIHIYTVYIYITCILSRGNLVPAKGDSKTNDATKKSSLSFVFP